MKNKGLKISLITLSLVTLIFTILVAFVDVSKIGMYDTKVGFSALNNVFYNLISYNEPLYIFTNITGYIIILIAFAYIILVFIQLIKNKSIKKIDPRLIIWGLFLIGLAFIYVLFDKVFIINTRPVRIDGKISPSYPSSHTMLSIFICATAIYLNQKLLKNKIANYICNSFILIVGILTLMLRTLSGVHWITDIIGGILISTTLVIGYITTIESLANKQPILETTVEKTAEKSENNSNDKTQDSEQELSKNEEKAESTIAKDKKVKTTKKSSNKTSKTNTTNNKNISKSKNK